MTTAVPRDVAHDLLRAIVRLRARLRTEPESCHTPWTRSQIATLARIATDGPTTVSALAAADYVRPQTRAETVAAFVDEGVAARGLDPADGRRVLISITDQGWQLLSGASRETWLGGAIEHRLSRSDRRTLAKAVEVMTRLADS